MQIKNKITNKIFSVITLGAIMAGSLGGIASSAFADATNVTTNPATVITLTDATLNATNGTADASGHSFWASTSTFSTDSATLPAGVYSTVDLGPVASSTDFSAALSSVAGLPAITPSTTYYYTAWTSIDGTWLPGAVETFTTLPTPTPTPTIVTTIPATSVTSIDASLNGLNGSADASGHSLWVSTSTFSTASSTIPAGVYSTVDLGAIASSTAFSAALSSATGIPAITPNTTYYFAAWSNVDGIWYPGVIQNFTTGTSTTDGTIGGTVTGGTDLVPGVLSVTGITAVTTTATADGSFADGWKYTFNITVPTDQTNLSMKFGDWTSGASILPAASNMRISSAQADNSGATVLVTGANTYTTPTLHITGDLDPTIAGDQVQVTVEVAVPTSTVNGSYSTSYGVKTN